MALGIGSLALSRGAQHRRRAVQTRATRRDPRRFGRRGVAEPERAQRPARRISEDLRLFATTFAAGFVFVSVFIA